MSDSDRVADILGDWFDRCEHGDAVDPEAVILAHPELAEQLREGFAALDAVDQVLRELPETADADPAAIGSHRVLRRLGSGGMGTVYLAEDEAGEPVALKVIHAHLLERPGFFKRFLREAELGRRVTHDNVVRTLDVDAMKAGAETRHFIVMEYVEGQTLRRLLDELGTVPEALLREIALQVAAGLAAIHEAGVVHRDVKPENVLITDDHRVRIMDLGVARGVDASIALTREGQFAGSLLYAAPEQFKRSAVGPAADLYALGVLLYELATGENPFSADEAAAVMNAHLQLTPPRVCERNSEISPFLTEVLATLLAKAPSERFPSAVALRDTLERGERTAWWGQREREVLTAAPSGPRVPVRRETALYGRETDLALLRQAWSEAKDGQGRTVLLEGEAGIGKTRLIDAFLEDVDRRQATALYGSYPPSGGLGGLSDALVDHFGAARLEDALRPYLTATPGLVPGFAALVRHEAPPVGSDAIQGDALHAAFVHLMRGIAAERPLLWVVEDLHFAEAGSREIVLSLARALEAHRVLLVLTTRPGLPEEEAVHFRRLSSHRQALLGRLSPREVILLLRDALRSRALAEKLGGRIALKSDGVPFFVFEMIRGLKEGQFLTELPDGSFVESKIIEEIAVPSAVRDLLEVRLGDLTKAERGLLDAGSVQGYEFDPDLIATVVDQRRLQVLQDLAAIERRLGVVRAVDARYRFDHHQIQEMVYGELPLGLRREFHSLLAEALEARAGPAQTDESEYQIARHHLQGREPQRAGPHLRAGLAWLATSHRPEEAIGFAACALNHPGLLHGEERAHVLLVKTLQHDTRGERDSERAAAEEALAIAEECGDGQLLARALTTLAHVRENLGSYDEARALAERSCSLCRELGDPGGEIRALNLVGNIVAGHRDAEEGLRILEQAKELAAGLGDRSSLAVVVSCLGATCVQLGRIEEGRALLQEALAVFREEGDRRSEAVSTQHLGHTFFYEGRYEEALECASQGLAIARAIGYWRGEATAAGNLAINCLHLGRLTEAEKHYSHSRDVGREIGDRRGEGHAENGLGRVALMEGRYEDARTHFDASLEVARELGHREDETLALGNLALTAYETGRLAAARELYAASLAIASERSDAFSQSGFGALLGRTLLCLGRAAEAEACGEEALRIARAAGYRREARLALGTLARAAAQRGDVRRALELGAEELELGRGLGLAGASDSCHALLARLEVQQGREERAISHLDGVLGRAAEGDRSAAFLKAAVLRAQLPGGDVRAALEELAESEGRVGTSTCMQVRLGLWRATHDPAHLDEAHRLLQHLLDHAPADCRDAMLEHVPLHRDIAEAWRERPRG